MEDFISKFSLLSSALLTLYAVIRVACILWFRPKNLEKQLRQQGIRGTSYKLLRGDMNDITASSKEAQSKPITLNHHISPRVFPFFYKMVQNYGKISLSWLNTRPRLIVADPELIRLILLDKSGHFIKPPVQNPLVDLLQLGVSTLEGEKWTKRRRLITPAFHFEKLMGMIPAFATSCCDLVHRWKLLASPGGSCEVDVAPEFQILAGDVISRTAFGITYEEGKKIFKLQKEQVILVLEAYYSIYFPGLRFIPTKKNKRRYDIDKQIKAILRGMIHKKEQARRNGETGNDDLLGLLLHLREQANNEMTIDDLIEECKLFYFAGQETTANWLTWTLIVLSMHPNWQERAREEVFQICGKKIPDAGNINRLKIVSMILHEVLRLYPPVAILYRHTFQKTSVKGCPSQLG